MRSMEKCYVMLNLVIKHVANIAVCKFGALKKSYVNITSTDVRPKIAICKKSQYTYSFIVYV